MVTEKEFDLLLLLKSHPFIQRGNFKSDKEFDYACEMTRDFLVHQLVHTSSNKPFQTNNTGKGSKYSIAGKFSLSATAINIVEFKTYLSYKKSLPKESNFNLNQRLTVLSILVAIVAIIATIIYAK